MSNDKQSEWVKANKNRFAKDFIAKSGTIPDERSTAIFMAGLPGAGKTEISKQLSIIIKRKFIRLDMDEIATQIPGYKAEKADEFRGGASELLNKIYDMIMSKGLDFIMDGTFGSKNSIPNIKRAISHGYMIKIFYVVQDPKKAWHFTKEREKIEHRAIDLDGFVGSYFNTIENLKEVLKNKHDNITLDIIKKDSYNRIKEWYGNVNIDDIDKNLKRYYNKESLRSYICLTK